MGVSGLRPFGVCGVGGGVDLQPGLQVVLDLRNQFGFKLLRGDKLPAYYDATYINAAKGK